MGGLCRFAPLEGIGAPGGYPTEVDGDYSYGVRDTDP
jgi:hypothetical protein